VIGGHPEVTAEATAGAVQVGVVLFSRLPGTQQAANGIVQEAHTGEKADRPEGVAEKHARI